MLRIALLSFFTLALAAQGAQTGARPQAASERQAENKIIGRIGNNIYRESDFFDYLPIVVEASQLEQVRNSPELQKQFQKSFLESMLLASKAKKEGIDKSPAFITKLAGITNALMMQEFVNSVAPELQRLSTPTEEQLKAYYEANKNNFKAQDTASARHILVSVRNNESETDKPADEGAKARVAKVQEELARGKSWQELAKEYSDDPGSKDNGGLYENFNPAQMVPEFAEAVRTQEIGKVGEPVKTQFGYHVILVENRKLDQMQTYDEAKASIQRTLFETMRNNTWGGFINSLKAELGYAEGEESAAEATGPSNPAPTGSAANNKPNGDKK